MNIAVVILNWNGKALLQKFLPSVLENSGDAVIYLADNASTDDSISFVSSKFPSIRIIENEANGGYAKGYALSRAKKILLDNNIKNALINIYKISTNRLTSEGKGESEPVGDNNTTEGKAQNRRVEFVKT